MINFSPGPWSSFLFQEKWNASFQTRCWCHSGETWEPVYNIPLGQFYQIHADNRLPFYYVMGGLQDNGAWTGPARTREPAGMADKLSRRSDGLGLPGKSQVVNKIGDIFFSVDGTNAAPTPAQRQYFQEIQPEYRERMAEVNRFINDTVPQWNEKLRAWNLPTLTTRKPVEF